MKTLKFLLIVLFLTPLKQKIKAGGPGYPPSDDSQPPPSSSVSFQMSQEEIENSISDATQALNEALSEANAAQAVSNLIINEAIATAKAILNDLTLAPEEVQLIADALAFLETLFSSSPDGKSRRKRQATVEKCKTIETEIAQATYNYNVVQAQAQQLKNKTESAVAALHDYINKATASGLTQTRIFSLIVKTFENIIKQLTLEQNTTNFAVKYINDIISSLRELYRILCIKTTPTTPTTTTTQRLTTPTTRDCDRVNVLLDASGNYISTICFSKQTRNNSEGLEFCKSRGMLLLTITSESKRKAISKNLEANRIGSIWISGLLKGLYYYDSNDPAELLSRDSEPESRSGGGENLVLRYNGRFLNIMKSKGNIKYSLYCEFIEATRTTPFKATTITPRPTAPVTTTCGGLYDIFDTNGNYISTVCDTRTQKYQDDALELCKSRGMTLLTITSVEKREAMKRLVEVRDYVSLWISGVFVNGTWVDSNNPPIALSDASYPYWPGYEEFLTDPIDEGSNLALEWELMQLRIIDLPFYYRFDVFCEFIDPTKVNLQSSVKF